MPAEPAITLRLDGREIAVAPGTTVAAALWNHGTFHFRTSPSGEPRGPLCGMGICFECRVTIDGHPHRRACLVPCAPGMAVETAAPPAQPPARPGSDSPASTAAGPGAAVDGARRGTAGLQAGTAVVEWTADVAVVGAGPAGIAAACAAAEAGARVVLLDAGVRPGGQVWRSAVGRQPAEAAAAARWRRRLAASGATVLHETTVVDAAPGRLHAERAGQALRIAAGRLVIATGARELWLPFPGWTLPNVVGVGGVQALLKGGADLRGRRVVVAGSGPLLLPVAASLARAGARLVAVAEQAPAAVVAHFAARLVGTPRRLLQAAIYRAAFAGTRYRTGVWVAAAHPAPPAPPALPAAAHPTPPALPAARSGSSAPRGPCDPASPAASAAPPPAGELHEVTLTDGRRRWRERCDLLACAHGLVPNLGLARLLGCAIDEPTAGSVHADDRAAACATDSAPEGGGGGGDTGGWRGVRVDASQRTSVEGVYCAGEAAGIGGLELALASGEIAGLAAAGAAVAARRARALGRRREREVRAAARLARAFAPRPELLRLGAADTVVCRCEDVRLGGLDPSWSARQGKLYTRAGMGACQGRVCGAALAALHGWRAADSVRAPLEPVTLAVLAGLGAIEGAAAPASPASGPSSGD
jgi:NADPH-dependent 2,4-dienoyl-CoA reductase/sulfur reductase-like enzyme